MIDLDMVDCTPVLVERATGLPTSDADWQQVPRTYAISLRKAVGLDFGSAQLLMHWGRIVDANDPQSALDTPLPPIAVDDCIRLRMTEIVDGEVEWGDEMFHGVVAGITWVDEKRAIVKVDDLGTLLAKVYLSRGAELNHNSAIIVDPGFLPAFNAIPGGDRALTAESDGSFVHDRRGTGLPWTSHQIANSLLIRHMRADSIPGAPTGITSIPWRLDPASDGDFDPETLDFDGQNLAVAIDTLASSKRNLTFRTTVADGYAQVLIIDLDQAGSALSTSADLGWGKPQIQERRDGFDHVTVAGGRPLIHITLWWQRGVTGGAIEPDGWTPGSSADAVLNAALLDDLSGKPYDRPEWRRFKLRSAWDGAQYDGTAGGSGTLGLRNILSDPDTGAAPDGTRWWLPPIPPPAALTIEREGPSGQGFTTSPTGPRQAPIVVAGKAGTWQDLSKECRPTPYGSQQMGGRNDTGSSIILLGDSAADADRLRTAVGADGWVLVTIGVREWAPLQAAWSAPADAWSSLSPRVHRISRPNLEEWIALAGCVTGVNSSGALTTLPAQLDIRSDVAVLQGIRDQLAVRFGRRITAATITKQADIYLDLDPGDVTSEISVVDGRTYPLDMPVAEIEYDFVAWTTRLRWSPLISETPKA